MRGIIRSRICSLTAVVVVSACLVAAVESRTGAASPNGPEAEASIRALLNEFFETAKKQDWEALQKLYADDCTMFSDGASVYDKKKYFELLQSEQLEVKSWKLDDLQIEVSGDLAWCRYRGYFDHGEFKVTTVETLIFKRQPHWKITHTHASVQMLEETAAAGS